MYSVRRRREYVLSANSVVRSWSKSMQEVKRLNRKNVRDYEEI